jgi:CheY-like chemotaxis protein
MQNKLTCILLIDDDEPTNFLSRIILEEADCSNLIKVACSGKDGLDYLTHCGKSKVDDFDNPCPDLIFLDINMPCMNGWEFLEKYTSVKDNLRDKPIIVILSTSSDPSDIGKAKDIREISEYACKPFTRKMLDGVLHKYFQNCA